MNTDIRIPDEFEEMMIIYFKDGEAKAASIFSKAEVVKPRDMAEEAIKYLQEKRRKYGHQDNNRR